MAVYRRRPGTKRPLRGTKRYRKYRSIVTRSLGSYQPSFSETFSAGTIQAGAGNIFSVRFNQIPEFQNYVNLYNSYQIRSVQVLLLPTQVVNTQSVAVPIDPPRIAFAVQSTSQIATPAAELDVLNDNGCKIRLLTKPLKIRASMRPQLSEADNTTTGLVPVTETNKRAKWLSTSERGVAVEHSGITYWLTQNYTTAQISQVNVFFKVYFAMRDPK